MSDIQKAIFKAKLELETITTEEIQRWALETLEKDSSDDLALEVCLLTTQEQVLMYFKQLSNSVFQLSSTEGIPSQLLKEYILNIADSITTEEKTHSFFRKVLNFCKYIDDEDLYNFTNSYEDELYFSIEGYSGLNINELFEKFINEIVCLLSRPNKTQKSF